MDKAKEVRCKVMKNRIFVVRRGSVRLTQWHFITITMHACNLPAQQPREMTSLSMQTNDILMDLPSSREGEERLCFPEPGNQELNCQQESYHPII